MRLVDLICFSCMLDKLLGIVEFLSDALRFKIIHYSIDILKKFSVLLVWQSRA